MVDAHEDPLSEAATHPERAPADVTQTEVDRRALETLGVVAHELLNTLAVASGYAGLLTMQTDELDGPIPEIARNVVRSLDQLALMLHRLRDSKLAEDELPLDLHTIDLCELVDETVGDLAATIASAHPVEINRPDQPIPVRVDELRVRQVLFNLVSNAVRYNPNRLPIVISVSVEGGSARLEVRNHGEGIAPEDAERMFEKFSRLDRSAGPNLGIGLWVSRAIAEAHGGRLTSAPAEGQGARLVLHLPVLTAPGS